MAVPTPQARKSSTCDPLELWTPSAARYVLRAEADRDVFVYTAALDAFKGRIRASKACRHHLEGVEAYVPFERYCRADVSAAHV